MVNTALALKEEEVIKAYKRLFSTPDGHIVLVDLEESLQLESSFVPGDPCATAFNEGARSTYLVIREVLLQELPEPDEPEEKKE